jgi:hypothetical protein
VVVFVVGIQYGVKSRGIHEYGHDWYASIKYASWFVDTSRLSLRNRPAAAMARRRLSSMVTPAVERIKLSTL